MKRLILFLAASASATAADLTLLADATVSAASPNTNQGQAASLRADSQSRAFLLFDAAGSLPVGTMPDRVSRAVLRLYVEQMPAKPPANATVYILSVSAPWSENTITSANQPLLLAPKVPVPAPAGGGQFLAVDVTELVKSQLASGQVNLAVESPDMALLFASKESSPGLPPSLDVTLANQGPQGPAGVQGPSGPPGPTGPTGAPGPAGPSSLTSMLTRLHYTVAVAARSAAFTRQGCPATHPYLVGGGCSIEVGATGAYIVTPYAIERSGPGWDHYNAWECQFRNASTGTVQVRTWAMCSR